jgi:hypothetical protein
VFEEVKWGQETMKRSKHQQQPTNEISVLLFYPNFEYGTAKLADKNTLCYRP